MSHYLNHLATSQLNYIPKCDREPIKPYPTYILKWTEGTVMKFKKIGYTETTVNFPIRGPSTSLKEGAVAMKLWRNQGF